MDDASASCASPPRCGTRSPRPRRAPDTVAPAAAPSCCPGCAALDRDNKRLRMELRAGRTERDQAAARILEAGDAERRRLERNLHDGAQQRLIGVALQLQLLGLDCSEDAETRRTLAIAQAEIAASLQELRELARGLHPAALRDHGLVDALRAVAARAALEVRIAVDVEPRPPAAIEAAVYYLVSEALTNVARHADADTARVSVDRRDRHLLVEVADDGRGGADPAAGSGLHGLADRVHALGGRLSITSVAGEGTTLRAEIPCATAES